MGGRVKSAKLMHDDRSRAQALLVTIARGLPRIEVGRRRGNDSLTKLIVTDPQYCMLRQR